MPTKLNEHLNSVNEVEEHMKIELKKKAEASNVWFKNDGKEKHDNKEYAHSER